MPQNDYNQSRQEFEQFREKLYQSFNYRRDTLMDLVDALAANTTARSPVELSLSPLFRREYSALYKGIQAYRAISPSNSKEAEKRQLAQSSAQLQTIADLIPTPKKKQFYLWALDVTPLPRPYAKTLKERTIIYQPKTIKGNKPIKIGHSYSVLTALPEREETGDIPWAIPLTVERVKSDQTGKKVGSQQLKQILTNENLPWSNHWSVLVVDSDYSAKTFLAEQEQHPNLVVEHEENWVSLSFLAYVQLWAARKLASSLPRRWERYLPNKSEDFLSPSLVQRDLNRIITEIGTPANSPKPRGFSSGRTEGMIQTKRTRHEVIKKGKKGKKLESSPPIAV